MHNQKNIFVIITGPSGAGKTTVANALLRQINNSVRLITTTTREKRPGEVCGVDYDFVTKEEFLKIKDCGEFFEYAQVYDQYYGSRKTKLKELLNKYSVVLSVIDVKGAQTIKEKMPNTLTVFIAPDSINELNSRLLERGCASAEDMKKRMKKAKYEMSIAEKFDVIIKNTNGKLKKTIDKTLMCVNKHIENY